MDPLQRRIQGLEKERWLYRILVVLGAGAGLLGVALSVYGSGGRGGAQLNANELVISDSAGRPRAQLHVDNDGQPKLVLLDTDNKPRQEISLRGSDSAPEIKLYSSTGNQRASLSITPEGQPAILLFDSAGRRRQSIGMDPLGDPRLEMFNADGNAIFTVETVRGQLIITDGQRRSAVFQ